MAVGRSVWCILILVTCYQIVSAEEEKKESNQNVNDKDSVINNEIMTRKNNTNKTVAKVEAILSSNPTLPRLTRGEIIAILENITKSDEEKSKLLNVNVTTENNYSYDKSVADSDNTNLTRDGKSLLVVLPYNPSNESRGGLEVLYTKEPMTRLLLEATTPSLTNQNFKNQQAGSFQETSSTSTTSTSTTPRPNKRRRKTMKPIVVMPQQEQRPVYIHNTKTTTTTQPPLEASSEEQWRPYTAYDSPSVVTQKPSTVDFPLPDNMKNTLNNFNLPKNHKPDGQSVYVTVPDKHEMFTTTTKRPRKKLRPKTTTIIAFSITPSPPTTKTPKIKRTTTTTPMPDISAAVDSLTPEMKDMLAQLGLVPGQPDGGVKSFNLPKSTTTVPTPINLRPINPTVDISSYMSFKPLPVKDRYNNKNNDVMDNDMKQILSNFGLLSNENQQYRMQKSLVVGEDDDDMNTTKTSESQDNKNETIEEQIPKNKQMTLSEINTDVLSDEMKDMLEDLGVIRDSKRRGKGHIFNPVTQSALLEDPEKAERISKVLGDIKKLSQDNKTHSLDPDAIKAHLENITSVVLDDDEHQDAEEDLSFSQSENEADDDEDHGVVFGANGNFDGYEPDEEELLRIQGVQDNTFANNLNSGEVQIKWNNTHDKQIDEDILSSKKLQEIMSHPDPLSFEELHQIEEDENKNEVKRQQPDSTTEGTTESATTEVGSSASSETTTSSSAPEERASSTTEAAAPETTTSTTTEAPPNIQDLEDSFGGETPLVRPNGLYFLLDWNSFLRVGQDNRTVNLSFNPKVGDPRNFIPVNVP